MGSLRPARKNCSVGAALAIRGGSTNRQLSGFLAGACHRLPLPLVCGTVHGGSVHLGSGQYSVTSHLGRKSIVHLFLPSSTLRVTPPTCRFVRTSGRLSVICRSRRLLLLGGGTNLLIRPSDGRFTSALLFQIRQCLCRGNTCSPTTRGDFTPTLIGHVSHGATNVIVTTGATITLHVLGSGLGRQRARGCCLYLIRNAVPGRRSALRKCLRGGRDRGQICVSSTPGPNTHAVHAGCAILSDRSKLSLLRVRLLANHARRVHTRLTDVNRPLLKSNGCNAGTLGGNANFRGRTLYSCGLIFSFAAPTRRLRCLGNGTFRLSDI